MLLAIFVFSCLNMSRNEVLGMPNLFESLVKENFFSEDGDGKQDKRTE